MVVMVMVVVMMMMMWPVRLRRTGEAISKRWSLREGREAERRGVHR
jgi:hypothetical protein